jgi:hypothetical protein
MINIYGKVVIENPLNIFHIHSVYFHDHNTLAKISDFTVFFSLRH